jgi:hypothetical protein
MQNSASRFVANIVPLQNVQSNTSGLDATAALSNSIADMQKMVNYSQRTIYADYLNSLTSGGSIGVLAPLALSNVGITSNGTALSFESMGPAAAAAISTLSTATSLLTLGTGTGAGPILNVTAQGSTLFTLSTSGDATFAGACYAQQFLTLSDERVKTGLRPWRSPVLEGVCGIGTYVYSYIGSPAGQGLEIGLLAHEVKAAFPDCVGSSAAQGQVNSYIKYDSLVALLVKAVQELREEVAVLRTASQGRSS